MAQMVSRAPDTSATASPRLLERVVATTAAAYDSQNVAQIDEAALSEFVRSGGVPLDRYRHTVSRVPLPLKFDDIAQEINFYSLLALLSFGCAKESELLKLTGSRVEDSVKFGLIGSHLGRETLDAVWMKNAYVGSVSEAFKIPVREASDSPIPGVTVDRPGALVSHAQAICAVLNESGEALLSRGYGDMAQFILHIAKSEPGVAGLVRALAGALPAFQDTESVHGIEVVMLKNAQVLAGELAARMGPNVADLRFEDTHELTAVADADVIAALIYLGILVPSSGAEPEKANGTCREKEASRAEVLAAAAATAFTPSDTAALRAAAVQACHRMAEALGDEYRPHEVSLFLKRLGRRKEYRELPRFLPKESRAV